MATTKELSEVLCQFVRQKCNEYGWKYYDLYLDYGLSSNAVSGLKKGPWTNFPQSSVSSLPSATNWVPAPSSSSTPSWQNSSTTSSTSWPSQWLNSSSVEGYCCPRNNNDYGNNFCGICWLPIRKRCVYSWWERFFFITLRRDNNYRIWQT